jgi:membrane protein implicated in regulation of membrane protease activity
LSMEVAIMALSLWRKLFQRTRARRPVGRKQIHVAVERLEERSGRVALDGYPPRAPTDPDVPD